METQHCVSNEIAHHWGVVAHYVHQLTDEPSVLCPTLSQLTHLLAENKRVKHPRLRNERQGLAPATTEKPLDFLRGIFVLVEFLIESWVTQASVEILRTNPRSWTRAKAGAIHKSNNGWGHGTVDKKSENPLW
jgi:hypothetical protein